MDGELSSGRYDQQQGRRDNRDNNNNHYGGGGYRRRGGGRRGGYHRGGGGRGGGRHYNNNRHHHPYNHRGGGRGGRSSAAPGNRFHGSTTSVDPQVAIMKQLSAMVSRVGELKEPPSYSNTSNTTATSMDDDADDDNDGAQKPKKLRPIMQAISKNITDLATVLCSESNAALFLKYNTDNSTTNTNIQDQVGPLVHLLVSSVTALPLQTPAYAGLTLVVHEWAPRPSHAGFAQRSVSYAMTLLGNALDQVLLVNNKNDTPTTTSSMAFLQCQHLLRYICLLAKINIVLAHDTEQDDVNQDFTTETSKSKVEGLSLSSLLMLLLQAAQKSSNNNNNTTVMVVLLQLLLSTLLHVGGNDDNDSSLSLLPSHVIQYLLQETDQLIQHSYKSKFQPGIGASALLLQTEQLEPGIMDDEEDDEDDDDEDEDTNSPKNQVCDSLQDLLRTVKLMLLDENHNKASRFAFLTDSPWTGVENKNNGQQVLYTDDEPLRLTIQSRAISSVLLMSSDHQEEENDTVLLTSCNSTLNGIVFGRLPIFGAPAADDDDDDDDEPDVLNEHLQAYQTNYSLVDRCLISQAVRDLLICHASSITDTGVERGSAKDTAEQVWSLCHVVVVDGDGSSKEVNNNDDDAQVESTTTTTKTPKGIEYALIEALFSVILQSSPDTHLRPLYASRVMLELVRAHPQVVPQALAVGVSNLFNFYLPTLVPLARDNFSQWFALHLTNTDYQWPKAYWDHWAKYVVASSSNNSGEQPTRNSRGDFVQYALELMAENLSSLGGMVTMCLPPGSSLVEGLIAPLSSDNGESSPSSDGPSEKELRERIWDRNEDPDLVKAYLESDEVTTPPNSNDEAGSWWRTRIVTCSLMQAVETMKRDKRTELDNAVVKLEQGMQEDAPTGPTQDVLESTTEAFIRYQSVLQVALDKDAEEGAATTSIGGAAILEAMAQAVTFSHSFFQACLDCVLVHEICPPESVLEWCLSNTTKNGSPRRWWEHASAAFESGLNKVIEATQVGNNNDLMVLDRGDNSTEDNDGGDNDDNKSKVIVEVIGKYGTAWIQQSVQLLCRQLQKDESSSSTSSDNTKRLTASEVDLVQGYKYMLLFCLERLSGKFSSSNDPKNDNNATEWFDSLGLTGPALAQACRDALNGYSSAAVDSMLAILENL